MASPKFRRNVQTGKTLVARIHEAAEAGALSEVQELIRGYIAANSTSAEAYKLAGQVFLKLGSYEDSRSFYDQAVTLAPADFDARVGLAFAARAAGQTVAAATAFEMALELQPHSVACLHDLAILYLELGRLDAASLLLTQALTLSPEHAGIYNSLAQLNIIRGRLDDAIFCARKAVRCDPKHTAAVLKLAELEPESSLFNTAYLEELLHQPELSTPDRRNLGIALGRIRESEGKYQQAFDAYQIGKEAHREIAIKWSGAYDRGEIEKRVEGLIRLYGPDDMVRLAQCGTSSEQPIFVLGMTRSGTTLVEQMLSRHPAVYSAGEQPALAEANELFKRVAVGKNGRLVRHLPKTLIEAIVCDYLQRMPTQAIACPHFVDKNPHNFFLIGTIGILFPRARIIHCRRDPIDTCLSNYFQIFSHHHNYSNRLEDIAHYYNQYQRLMSHWQLCGLENLFELQYETLIADPEGVVRGLLEHCGLDWHEQCLTPQDSTRPVLTPSQLQVRKPLYSSSVERWRNYAAFIGPLVEGPDAVSQYHRGHSGTTTT